MQPSNTPLYFRPSPPVTISTALSPSNPPTLPSSTPATGPPSIPAIIPSPGIPITTPPSIPASSLVHPSTSISYGTIPPDNPATTILATTPHDNPTTTPPVIPRTLSARDSSTSRIPSNTVPTTPYIPVWTQHTHRVVVSPFTSTVCPTFHVPNLPLAVFEHFLPDHFLQEICTQTNLYVQQVMGTEKYQEWEKINVMELKAYLGFSILMGLVKLPSLEDYWKVDPFLHYAPIADRIARQRFRDISRYLHFVDNASLIPP